MKVFNFILGLAVLAVFGLAAYSWYMINYYQTELNRRKTEPARMAKSLKNKEKDLNSNDYEEKFEEKSTDN